MNLKIIFGVFILIFIIYILYLIFKPSDGLTAQKDGTIETIVTYEEMYDSSDNYEANRSYSIWFFISEWETTVHQKSILKEEGDADADSTAVEISLEKEANNLNIDATDSAGISTKCTVENIPLQKWINVIITIYDRSIDTYLNGKLINTCVLDSTVESSKAKSVVISSNKLGFAGYTAKFQYFAYIVNPQKAWDIYSSGFSEDNWLTSMFSSDYGIKLAWMENDTEQSSVTI